MLKIDGPTTRPERDPEKRQHGTFSVDLDAHQRDGLSTSETMSLREASDGIRRDTVGCFGWWLARACMAQVPVIGTDGFSFFCK